MQAADGTRRLPGVEGVWFFVAADLVIFGVLFVSFMQGRQENLPSFAQSSRALNFNFGGINTLILLTSSWFVAMAVEAIKQDRPAIASRCLSAALALGVAFGVSKIIEYSREFSSGVSMLTNDFYMYYFTLTGIHFAHVVAGCVVLYLLRRKAARGGYSSSQRVGLETGATYWHMVDLLWIVIFPLLYLLR